MAKASKADFKNEAALCAAFIASVPEEWTAYAETAGFDILLVRKADGAQIGVEAKMTLNAKVLLQAVEGIYSGHGREGEGPDFRAALVPAGTAGAELKQVARYLGLTVIECNSAEGREAFIQRAIERMAGWGYPETNRRPAAEREADRDCPVYSPELPKVDGNEWRVVWNDFCPAARCKVPEYVPDVVAGASGPSQLSEWKIKAIKICILMERRGFVTCKDFAHIKIDRKRWHDMGWISHDHESHARGQFVAGKSPLNLRTQHPVNYEQIAADFEKWAPKTPELLTQGELV